jgi:hypothetical protein
MLKAGMLQDQSQQDRCTLATLSEALTKFGLVPWPVDRLALKDVGRAVRAAYISPFVRCKNMQRLGCAVPWNRPILRSLSARRMSGPGRNRISNRKAVKVSCIFFLLKVPKELVNEVQPLRRMPSRSVAYVESGDVTGPESAGQMHSCYLV